MRNLGFASAIFDVRGPSARLPLSGLQVMKLLNFSSLLLFTVLGFALAVPVSAHAVLVSSKPAAGTAVAGPEIAILLTFNSRIDAGRSRLILVKPDKSTAPLTLRAQPSPAVLSSIAHGLSAGSYLIRWQVLATDGHITRGELSFRVR